MRIFSALCIILFSCSLCFAQYPHNGYAPDLKRISGTGNGDNWLELTDPSLDSIINYNRQYQPSYKGINAPVKISVYDTSLIIAGDYEIIFDTTSLNGNWKMYRVGTTDTVYSSNTISSGADQFIPQWGLVVTVNQIEYPAEHVDTIGHSVTFSNPNTQWLGWINDTDAIPEQNWIWTGSDPSDYGHDTLEIYENFVPGWSPYFVAATDNNHTNSTFPIGFNWAGSRVIGPYSSLFSFDLVITADTTLWTRCPVVEAQADPNLSSGFDEKQELRSAPSVNKLGMPDSAGTGMGWFPGYVIDVESGQRLNLAFSENSFLSSYNGNDMLFNPDSIMYDSHGQPVFGGMHMIYIFMDEDDYFQGANRMPEYDGGNYISTMLHGTATQKLRVWRSCRWVGYPILKSGYSNLESDVTLKVRVAKRHEKFYINSHPTAFGFPHYALTIPTGTLDVNDSSPASSSVNLYPNPLSEKSILILNDLHASILSCSIYDINGKLIYAVPGNNSNSIILEKNDLSSGMYFYQVVTSRKEFLSGKFFIN